MTTSDGELVLQEVCRKYHLTLAAVHGTSIGGYVVTHLPSASIPHTPISTSTPTLTPTTTTNNDHYNNHKKQYMNNELSDWEEVGLEKEDEDEMAMSNEINTSYPFLVYDRNFASLDSLVEQLVRRYFYHSLYQPQYDHTYPYSLFVFLSYSPILTPSFSSSSTCSYLFTLANASFSIRTS